MQKPLITKKRGTPRYPKPRTKPGASDVAEAVDPPTEGTIATSRRWLVDGRSRRCRGTRSMRSASRSSRAKGEADASSPIPGILVPCRVGGRRHPADATEWAHPAALTVLRAVQPGRVRIRGREPAPVPTSHRDVPWLDRRGRGCASRPPRGLLIRVLAVTGCVVVGPLMRPPSRERTLQ